MLIVALGDTHIPDREKVLNKHILNFIREEVPNAILFTGDATDFSTLFFLRTLGEVYAVKGNMDETDAPPMHSLKFGNKKIMLIHGHQFGRGNYDSLTKYAHGHDILVCGHTHKQEHFVKDNILVVNPGSATGAPSGPVKGLASFTTIVIKGDVKVTEYVVKENGIQSKGSKSKD
ncbi:MAG: metallophosphoesterase family protein [Candidatus Altiarchaeota archaeon]|nr:metallophosphoesterase family protein [Candidatus Altiarchaeota archaeon]